MFYLIDGREQNRQTLPVKNNRFPFAADREAKELLDLGELNKFLLNIFSFISYVILICLQIFFFFISAKQIR